jgi:hypothetical protein
VPALPPPQPNPLSPRRQAFQHVLIGWVLGVSTMGCLAWLLVALGYTAA